MGDSNRDRVGKALELVGAALGVFVDRRMARRSPKGAAWKAQYSGENLDSDPSALITVVLDHWQDVFRDELRGGRNWIGEIRDWRNRWAHQGTFSDNDAYRALDTAERLLVLIDAPEAAAVAASKAELAQAQVRPTSTAKRAAPAALISEPAAGLRPWREVVAPHDDVAQGRFDLAEFAANLSQVTQGAGRAEYTDPVEFFRRTYLTAGLRTLLAQAAQRVTGVGGAPVVNLQTNFGGGKTHSMIALYHLFCGLQPAELTPEVKELLATTGIGALPEVTRAVVVGTRLSPSQPEVKPDGTEVRTIWGEIAWCLGGKDAFEMVAEADRTATSPGGAMEDVLRVCAPCLILIDEWVAYARQLYGAPETLPAGTFETQFSFAQTLADAAIAVPGALLVVSLPVSDDPARPGAVPIGSEAEVGGAMGQEAARRLGNVIGRIETPWRPASREESFEIVRRRLFEPIAEEKTVERDATVRRFADLYRSQSTEFPAEVHETGYAEQMRRAYPVHPELFARLYDDWSTLEGFQRTRGVLRLMAAVIRALWVSGDQSPLILPANVPVADPVVEAELVRNLDHAWPPIIDTDIDGEGSVPAWVDTTYKNLGRYRAASKAARAVFLAATPRAGSPNQGVELQRVKLGCAVPGETVASYADALNRLSERSSYLYVNGARYWYGTQASIAKRARDLIDQYLSNRRDEIHAHIVERLGAACRNRGELTAVHVCPAGPAEVPDLAECRLVVLGPAAPHVNRDTSSAAMQAAAKIFGERGSGSRLYRNMVVFLAADHRRLEELEHAVAEHLAWSSIHAKWEELGLDAFGRNQAAEKRVAADKAVDLRLYETYHWALVPSQPDPTGPVAWDAMKAEGQGGLAERTSRKLVNSGELSTAYSAELLRGLLSEGGPIAALWSDGSVSVNEIWDAFARYVYLPRLRDVDTLCRTVARGPAELAWREHGFAVSDAYDPSSKRYVGLVTGAGADHVSGTSLVIRPDLAAAQLDADATESASAGQQPPTTSTGTGQLSFGGGAGTVPSPPAAPGDDLVRRFYAVAHLDPERSQRDFSKLAAEIVTNLAGHLGTEVAITVEITARNDAGFPDSVVRTVEENAKTLKIDPARFEKD